MFDHDVYISIGQPLGYTFQQNNHMQTIDTGGQTVVLSPEEYLAWCAPTMAKKPEPVSVLVDKNCLLNLREKAQVEILEHYVLFRQGFAGIYADKHAVFLGETPICITESQLQIWRLADGKATVGQIMCITTARKRQFITDLLTLISYDLVYIKRA